MAPIAAEYAAALPLVAPWAARATFAGASASLAWTEAQLALLREYVDEHGLLDADGKPRPAVSLMDRLEGRAGTLRGELGLTPQALARLLGTLAQVATAGHASDGLAHLKAEGARILAARTIGPAPDDDEPESAA